MQVSASLDNAIAGRDTRPDAMQLQCLYNVMYFFISSVKSGLGYTFFYTFNALPGYIN